MYAIFVFFYLKMNWRPATTYKMLGACFESQPHLTCRLKWLSIVLHLFYLVTYIKHFNLPFYMLLAIDIGNTNIVFGIHTGKKWLPEWRLETSLKKSASDHEIFLRSCFLECGIKQSQVEITVVSSVVPSLTQKIQVTVNQFLGLKPVIIGPEIYPKLPLQVRSPNEIGTDLVANALAGFQLSQREASPKPVIVVDFGTALTFTVIDERGKMLGVTIAPGLVTSIRALSGNTAQLPEVPLEMPASAIGTNTVTALQAGILKGYVGLVSHMLQEIEGELGQDCFTIATGGLSAIITPLKPYFDVVDKNLTLNGMKAIAEIVSKC